MSTIINNPGDKNSDSGVGLGLLVGVIIAAFAVLLFFVYGIPGLNRTEPAPTAEDSTTEIDIQLPNPEINPSPAPSPSPAPAESPN